MESIQNYHKHGPWLSFMYILDHVLIYQRCLEYPCHVILSKVVKTYEYTRRCRFIYIKWKKNTIIFSCHINTRTLPFGPLRADLAVRVALPTMI